MIDLMSIVFGTEPTTNEGKIGQELAATYHRTRLIDEAMRSMVETEDEKLRLEGMRLDNAMRRRAMGLPMTSDDLEMAQNENRPFATTMTTLAGREVLQRIPDVSHFRYDPVKMPWAQSSRIERGILSAITGVGGKYAGRFGGGIRRFFG